MYFPITKPALIIPEKSARCGCFKKTARPIRTPKCIHRWLILSSNTVNAPTDIAFELPCVFKFDWGGEGETVYLINSREDLKKILKKAADFEKSGQKGFLLQEYVPTEGKTLRVVIIGRTLISYWRIQENTDGFMSSVSRGARIEASLQPRRQNVAKVFVKNFCNKTGINLAGFDVIFAPVKEYIKPLMLEINYFFGRKGLGGSDAFYEILKKEIHNWLASALNGQDG